MKKPGAFGDSPERRDRLHNNDFHQTDHVNRGAAASSQPAVEAWCTSKSRICCSGWVALIPAAIPWSTTKVPRYRTSPTRLSDRHQVHLNVVWHAIVGAVSRRPPTRMGAYPAPRRAQRCKARSSPAGPLSIRVSYTWECESDPAGVPRHGAHSRASRRNSSASTTDLSSLAKMGVGAVIRVPGTIGVDAQCPVPRSALSISTG